MLLVARAINLYCAGLALGIPAALALVILPPLTGRESAAGAGVAIALSRSIAVLWAMIGLTIVSGALWLLLEGGAMSGRGLAGATSPTIIGAVLWRTRFGFVLLLRLVLIVALASSLLWLRRASTPRGQATVLATASGFAACGFLAVGWSGHAAASADPVQLVSDLAHLLGAGLWLGGLIALAILFGAAREAADRGWIDFVAAATHRFFWLGIACVGTLLITGIVNSWYMVGSVPALIGTAYGYLLLIKVALFAAMLGLATLNQFRLAPGLDRAVGQRRPRAAAPALRALQRNAALEAMLGFLVIGLVSGLGSVPPGTHSQPWWPLPWRFSLEAMALPTVSREIWLATAAVAVGGIVILLGIVRRSWRVVAVPLGLVIVVFAAPSFRLLTLTAYPTSFAASPVAYTTASVARGAALYAGECVACHGPHGKGNGEAAGTLEVPPADLTAAHVLDHSEGDIFWWLTAGIPESGMPGFADALSEAQRWDIVNFVRTLPVGGLDDGLTPALTEETAPRAPDFSFRHSDGSEETLLGRAAAAPLLLVFFTPADETAEDSRLHRLAASRGALAEAGLDLLAFPLTEGPAARGPLAQGGDDPDLASLIAAADGDVAATYRLIAISRSRAAAPPTHLEFLVDRAGYLRALWQPGREPGSWDDLRAVIRLVAQLEDHPLAAAPAPAHVHTQ